MVLEATVVCVDNSDFMINGDYKPTRLQAQAEAVNLLAGAKTGSNPENTVGVLSLAGVRGPKVRPERPTLTWARDPQPPTNPAVAVAELTRPPPLPLSLSSFAGTRRFWPRPRPTWAGFSTACGRSSPRAAFRWSRASRSPSLP